jgi:hypothetical protein
METNLNTTKGIIFAGCSFTWGQGLYYYSNMSTLKEPPPDEYDISLITTAHLKFMESIRFPRLVSNNFKTFEIVHPDNGGSDDKICEYWKWCFGYNSTPIYHFDEFGYLIYQLTQPIRVNFQFDNTEMCLINERFNNTELYHKFLNWLSINDIDFDNWYESHILDVLNLVKNTLQWFELNGIKTRLLTWPEEYVKFIMNDEWLLNRFIPLKYNNNNYNSIEELISNNKSNMIINSDYNNFKIPPKDHHPSLKCHQVISDNIIQNLKNTIFNYKENKLL